MFTLSEKRMIISITMVVLFVLIFAVLGCGSKDNDVLNFAMTDDGQAPQAPEIISANSEYLYNQEEDVDSHKKHFAVLVQWKQVNKNLKGEAKGNIMGYRVYRNQKDVAIGSTDYGVEMFEDFDYENLREGGIYTYYVSAVDAMKRETFSDGIRVELHAEGEEPSKPRNFYVLPAENKVAVLSWEKPSNADEVAAAGDPICKYKIRRRESGEQSFSTLAVVPEDMFTFYDDTIVENLSYAYRVYAVTQSGNVSQSSDERSISYTFNPSESLAPPTAPIMAEVQPDNTSGVANAKRVTWRRPTWDDDGTNGSRSAQGVAAYRVYRAMSSSMLHDTGEIMDLTYELVRIVPAETGEDNYFIDTTIDTVDASKAYYYRISAINRKGLEGDWSMPAYYDGNSSSTTDTPTKFSCLVDKEGEITVYFSFSYDYLDDQKTFYVYKSLNKRYFDDYYKIQAKDLTLDATTGEIYAHFKIPEKLQKDDLWYLKLAAHHDSDTFHSNLSYWVKVEKFSLLKDNKYILQAEHLVPSVRVRDAHYAWYANFLYPSSMTGNDSLWGYDINEGEHYTIGTSSFAYEGKGYTALRFDPMGAQHPPTADRPVDAFTAGISNEISYSTADYAFCDLITNETTALGGWTYLEDTARPIMTARSQTYSQDTYPYYYITAYNDDGYTYWQDIEYDGVEYEELFYRETQMPLLQHGMEGSDLRITYDVDPWTHREPTMFANVYLGISLTTAETGTNTPEVIYDFWPTVITDSSGDQAWEKNDFDWNGGNGVSGGCAYYMGPDSGRAIMARDYFADGHGDFAGFRITWRENYFGPLYSNGWPGYAGNWPGDAYNWDFVYPDHRPQRKDNCISYDLSANGIDYEHVNYVWQMDRVVYDMYQDQMKFEWNPPESGQFHIDLYFYETMSSGEYLVKLMHRGSVIGSPSIIDLSRHASVEYINNNTRYVGAFNDPTLPTSSPYDAADARDGRFTAYLEANYPITFIFSPMSGNTDVFHDTNYDFSEQSAFELNLERIEFTRIDED